MAEREMTQEEIDALPPDVRKALGLTPTPERPATPEDLAAAGVTEPSPPQQRQPVLRLPFMDKPSAALDTFALRGADAVPAGGMLSDLIGTAILKAAKLGGVGEPGAVLPPQAQAELYQLATKEGIPPEEAEKQIRDPGNPIGDATEVYRRLRDTRRADTASLSKENPWSGRAGEGVGTVASILAPLPGFKAGKDAGVLARLGASAATGAGYGALAGFTSGPSDLSRGDWKGTAADIVDNALGGAAFGAGIGALSEGASRAWPSLRRYAVRKAEEVLSGSSDMGAVNRKPLRPESAEEVLSSGGIQAFDTTPQTHERVAQLSDEAGTLLGEIISELEARGIRGPRAQSLAEEMLGRYQQEFANSGANKGPATVFLDEANNISNLAGLRPHLGLEQAEKIKRSLQREAKFHRRQASPNEESLQEASSILRQAVEERVANAGKNSLDPEVQSLANAFVPAKQRAGRLMEAEEFSDRAASKYLQKPNVSAFDRLTGAAASGGNPVQAELQAQALSQARRRMPSALARYGYDLSQGMETGAVTPALSKAFALMFDPTMSDTTSALLDYLRRSKKDDKR